MVTQQRSTKQNSSTKSKKKQRQHYSDEFKRDAVALADKVGTTQACEELNITSASLYSWRQKQKYEATKSGRERAKDTEIAKLKRELAEKNEELAILKKAATYFAKNLK